MEINTTITKVLVVWIGTVLLFPLLIFSQTPGEKTATAKTQKTQKNQIDLDETKFALLVGINRYKVQKEFRPLFGSENDVDLMFAVLVKDYGFKAHNIRILKSEDATAGNIRNGLRWLIENAARSKKTGNEPTIVFFFSGHGSQVANQPDDKDEIDDSRDEAIVPYDSRQGNIFDLRDDEIDDYCAEISRFTHNITLIFDSCNSGTVSRGDENLTARLAREDKRPQPDYKRRFHLTSQDRKENYVTLSASISYQRAYERDNRLPGEPPNGTFTYYLVQALRRANRTTSYRDLIQEVSIGVKSEIPSGQDPQAEGNIDSYIFLGAAIRSDPYIAIASINHEKNEVVFEAGQVHGVKPGSIIAIYSNRATSFRGTDGFLTNAIVKENGVKLNTSVAALPKPLSEDEAKIIKQVDELSKVVLLSPNFGGGSFRLDLDGSNEKSLKDNIVRDLKTSGLIENDLLRFADGYDNESRKENYPPLITLKRGKLGQVFPKANMLLPLGNDVFCNPLAKPESDEEIIYLDDGTGHALFGYYAKSGEAKAENFAKVIDIYAKQRNLLALSNNASKLGNNIKITLELVPGIFTKKCENGVPVRPKPDPSRKNLIVFDSLQTKPQEMAGISVDQAFEIKIKNISKQRVYVTAILVGADGSIEILYPNGGNALDSAMQSGSEATLGKRVATTPLGREQYIYFVTKEPTDFSFLETPGIRREKGNFSMLEKILTHSGTFLSRGKPISDDPDQWGIIKFALDVLEKH